ncbi:hypothetical protein [Plebeiibacterium sediminum]|uniref:Uncharacterized protein n=1 Tax=Plebeiibacterium sediminum TaxID=2992112 RepID=A0AAE3SIU5_9BACT|nr:hypothetical protein [Plebeiobacterium sediminum]MCW3789633.1 hypothetical protein [Plebeiobacterium sediminum]
MKIFFLTLLHCQVTQPQIDPVLEKFLVALLGIVSAIASTLITDYFIKRRRQRIKNIRDGKYSLEVAYNEKLADTNYKENSVYILPPLTDFDLYLKDKGKSVSIIRKKLNSPYSSLYEAENELKYIKDIFDN